MTILFLDIDGVVNHSGTQFKYNHWPLERYCAFLVGKIKLDTGCEVVLSSSWRVLNDGMKEVEERIVKLLDRTPTGWAKKDGTLTCRGDEIKAWLDKHPKVTRYAILDDESDMLPEQMPNFFKTNFHEGGLTDEIAARITKHLLAPHH